MVLAFRWFCWFCITCATAVELHSLGEPRELWQHFLRILDIPRCSGNEAAILEYIHQLAEEKGLRSHWNTGNLIVSRPGADGEPIIVQTHVDMVCEKQADMVHDFDRDGISVEIRDGWLVAPNTTLGADNGIGVAMALQIMTMPSSQPSPPIEFIFTVKEEIGLDGARALSPELLPRRLLLNFDSEEWGILYIGSAGGATDVLRMGLERVPLKKEVELYDFRVDGLVGGHSGADIHKNRGNALKIAAAVAMELFEVVQAQAIDIEAGDKDNAIPRSAIVKLAMTPSDRKKVDKILADKQLELRNKLSEADVGVKLSLQPTSDPGFPMHALSETHRKATFGLINMLPHGPLNFSEEVPGLVETSNNVASIKVINNSLEIVSFARSAVDRDLGTFRQRVQQIAEEFGASVARGPQLPGWAPSAKSPLLALVKQAFEEVEGSTPGVTAIHAGLECGVFAQKLPGIDMVSFGPDIQGAHAPGERVRLESVSRFCNLVLKLLSKLSKSTPSTRIEF